MSAYATDKILAHLPVIQQLRCGEQPSPIHVQMVLSDLCNQDCNFCAYRMSGYTSNQLFGVADPETGVVNNNPNRMIPQGKAIEILNDCKAMGVRAVQFTGGGEPTAHPHHRELIGLACDLGLDVALVTNGMRMGRALQDTLKKAVWVRVSIDAGTPNTYAHIRKVAPAVYDRVIRNVSDLVKVRDDAKTPLTIGISFVVTADNWREVVQAARTARDIGVDAFRISALFQPDDCSYFAEFQAEAAALCHEADALSTDAFRVANLFGNRLSDLSQGHPDYKTCSYQHVTTYIGGDLNVYRCCNTAYNERGLIGSLENQGFRELWESEVKREAFREFDARGCERCMFNAKNRAINEVVEFRATHDTFV